MEQEQKKLTVKKSLKVRSKIVIIIMLCIVVFSVLIYYVSYGLLLKSYRNIERDQTIQNVQRVRDAVKNSVTQLDLKLIDWAWWDDSYKFIKDNNKEYIDSNLGITSVANLKVNAMVFIGANGQIVFDKLIDFKTKKELSAESVSIYINEHEELKHLSKESKIEGIIMLPEGPMLIAASPILTSEGNGPVYGVLLLGKFLDNDLVNSLGELTHLPINTYIYNDTLLPDDVIAAKKELSKEREVFTSPLSNTSIAGYTALYDTNGKQALILKIETPREVYNQGLETLYSFLIIAVAFIILFGVFIIILFEVFFIIRFSKLSKEVEHISETKDFKERLTEGKKDEVGMLSMAINQMLDTLSASREKELLSNKLAFVAEQKLNDRLKELETINKVMVDRELKMIELKEEIATLKNGRSV